MNIWLNKITGQVDIINGLNHYIGMKHIKAEMFPEFGFLVYIIGFFILFGLVVAATGKLKLLGTFLLTLLVAGVVAMVDFYKWGYDYGHNLDPKAAIQIPGFSYQPPLFGHKTLLNFDAYSYPDSGGWVIITAAGILFITWLVEWRERRKMKGRIVSLNKKELPVAAMICMLVLSSCNPSPEAINYGKDMCADCKMTIMDAKFGAEIITKKGKVYKFDDAHCVRNIFKNNTVKSEDVWQVMFLDFEDNTNFLDAHALFFVTSPQIKSPMNGNVAAFANKQSAESKAKQLNGEVITWDQFFNAKQ
jgi:copper chaperone NosL